MFSRWWMRKLLRPKLLLPAAATARGPKELARSVRCNSRARSWIGRFIATVARSLVWQGWCPANGVPETKNGAAPSPKWGVPALRRIIVEMVWRIIFFQPQYKPVQKWLEVLRGPNPGRKKKAVIAIGRQLIVDLWRLQTGRVTAQELNLIMVTD